MQLNKVFKGMLIALPVVTLMACSSTDSNQISEEQAAAAAAEQARIEREAEEARAAQVAAAQEQKRIQEEREAAEQAALANSTVYFDFDRSSLTSASQDILKAHADFLSANSNKSVTIEGHCDSRGTPEYNIALGERRAKAIETYLLNAGVSAYQITVVSYGEEKPAVQGSTEAAFEQNRRGVLVYQ